MGGGHALGAQWGGGGVGGGDRRDSLYDYRELKMVGVEDERGGGGGG